MQEKKKNTNKKTLYLITASVFSTDLLHKHYTSLLPVPLRHILSNPTILKATSKHQLALLRNTEKMTEAADDRSKEKTLFEPSDDELTNPVESAHEDNADDSGEEMSESSGESDWVEVTDDGEEDSEEKETEEETEEEAPGEYAVLDNAGNVMIEPVSHKGKLKVPSYGMKFLRLAGDDVDIDFLKEGEKNIVEYQSGINGHLNEELYEMVRTNTLSIDALCEMYPTWHRCTVSGKYMFLTKRYHVSEKGIIHDRNRGDKVVCEPVQVYDIIMSTHLMNDHSSFYKVYDSLTDFYANITRSLVAKAIQYCSVCNPQKELVPLRNKTLRKILNSMCSYEKIQVEIIEPFPGEKIEGRYSHIMLFRDFHSRYRWIRPLKNVRFKKIVKTLGEFLLEIPRPPMYLETMTLEWQDMFDICEEVSKRYHFSIGLGTQKPLSNLSLYIGRLKKCLERKKTECLQDWNMCVKYGVTIDNRNPRVDDRCSPAQGLFTEIEGMDYKYKYKLRNALQESSSKHILKIGQNSLYLEVTKDGEEFVDEDEDANVSNYSEEEEPLDPRERQNGRRTEDNDQTQADDGDNLDDLINMVPIDPSGASSSKKIPDVVDGETQQDDHKVTPQEDKRSDEDNEDTPEDTLQGEEGSDEPSTLFYRHPSQPKRRGEGKAPTVRKRARTKKLSAASMSMEI